jgi:hypothetical protein
MRAALSVRVSVAAASRRSPQRCTDEADRTTSPSLRDLQAHSFSIADYSGIRAETFDKRFNPHPVPDRVN